MLWERSVTEQRYNAVLEVLEAGLAVVEVAGRYGVSRQSVHTWIGRYRAGGLEGLADRSHRPNRCPHQLAERSRPRCASCAASIPGGGRSGFATSWNGVGSSRCRAGWPSTGCWYATG